MIPTALKSNDNNRKTFWQQTKFVSKGDKNNKYDLFIQFENEQPKSLLKFIQYDGNQFIGGKKTHPAESLIPVIVKSDVLGQNYLEYYASISEAQDDLWDKTRARIEEAVEYYEEQLEKFKDLEQYF